MLIAVAGIFIIAGLVLVGYGDRIDNRRREKDKYRPPILRYSPDAFPARARGAWALMIGVMVLAIALLTHRL